MAATFENNEEIYAFISASEALQKLNSSRLGLSDAESKRRLAFFGLNEIKESKKRTLLDIFIDQFRSILIIILVAAVVVSGLIGELTDSIFILLIVVLNAVFGVVQEYQANKAISALKKLAPHYARVLRNGKEKQLPASELVPGDILMLEEGNSVPADARLLESIHLSANESSLTGESFPSEKHADLILKNVLPINEQGNMLFMSTSVVSGRGIALVTRTGMNSQIGKIATQVDETPDEKMPLEGKIDDFGKKVGAAALIICVIVFILGVMHGFDVAYVLLLAVSLAVAAIPEGLPAILTITLAIGTQRMARRNAIVRRLPAVETLGSATVICSDKTGTLTRNEMMAEKICLHKADIEVSGEGYAPEGEFKTNGKTMGVENDKRLNMLFKCCALCNNSSMFSEKGVTKVNGDTTEAALLVLSAKAEVKKETLSKELVFLDENPFDSKRKLMSVLYSDSGKAIAFVKGAPEEVIKKSNRLLSASGTVSGMSSLEKNFFLNRNRELGLSALRVIAVAYRELPKGKHSTSDVERDLILIGLVGIRDPPRSEARESIALCKKAGIKVYMLTGDNENTAFAVAKEIGLAERYSVINGEKLDAMSDKELLVALRKNFVFARVSPANKTRIVKVLKGSGEVVGVTGDGVNDVLALKTADIGISMGITGTDVSKESSDLILADDNFVTIVAAVEQGRVIYDNIAKSVRYLISCNLGELMVILSAILIGLPFPLLAIQILWMNLVTDGLPAIALGTDTTDVNVMNRLPRKKSERIIGKKEAFEIFTIGLLISLGTLGLFVSQLNTSPNDQNNIRVSQTMAFTVLVLLQLLSSLVISSSNKSFLGFEILSNRFLIFSVMITAVLQVLAVQLPYGHQIFKTSSLNPMQWLSILFVCLIMFIVFQALKFRLKLQANSRFLLNQV